MDTARFSIELVEVGPRDGLQNEARLVSTADKVELVRRSIAAGVRRIEVASFVNPHKVPQMADAEAMVAMLGPVEGVTRIGLVLNQRGAERAIAAGVDQLGAVAAASDAFGIRNQGQDSAESAEVAARIVAQGRAAGLSAQVTIAAAFGCPFTGEVDPAHVIALAARLAEAEPCEIALAGTVGVAVPAAAGQGPFPQYPRHRDRQRLGGDRGGRAGGRCGDGRAGRLPLRAGRGRQCCERGRRLSAWALRNQDRARSRQADRDRALAGTGDGQAGALDAGLRRDLSGQGALSVGEHNAEIYGELLGIGSEGLVDLAARGVI